MSRAEIVHYLRQLLMEKGSASLPGIGAFAYSRRPSHITDNYTHIHPPKYSLSLVFDEEMADKGLASYIVACDSTQNLSQIHAEITAFGHQIRKLLSTDGVAEIEDIGILHQNPDGIWFEPNENANNWKNQGFPIITAKPLTGRYGASGARLQENPKPSVPVSPGRRLKNTGAAFTLENLWPLFVLLALLALLIYFMESTKNSAAGQTDKQEITNVVVDTVGKTTDSVEKENIPLAKPNPDSVVMNPDGTYSGKCIIIVGSFKDAKNILRMTDMLNSKGYKSLNLESGSMTRVGFTFSCDSVNLTEYIHKIRADIDKGAWYLQPAITVE